MSTAMHLTQWWRNTKEMPLLLRLLCQGGMVVAPIFLILLVLPISEWDMNGRTMSYTELWTSGAGVSMTVCFALVLVGTWGLAARRPRSRWALVFAPVAPYAVLLLFPWSSQFSSESLALDVFALQILGAGAIYACLFHLRAVREYLGRYGLSENISA